ncbi:MAG: CcoQ/FixQ family Cbb3-type cytochrome c oxidase assembly chaperone [Roseobacter sp.]|nr:CcoQ/FixQ family Cbb3-type cytochrome c oxidase assembly chaperone [Roseobacter sp.]MBV46974.1 CcoQ/FixQ family Cbb3-type cytochrome c oxidase assembly chaperone [Roseobacter sp.]MBV47520.1 CcoQ/FixQ family Cbb3-type cytochrome c oxidase assembly chaperone [Roseobacter sp.]|tara:strand:- start:539 stop:745 length:207 start_codon:yes stop_codon:yes gene_type:complete
MDRTHEWYVLLSKSFGLFWLLGLSVGITAYAFWPSLGGRFDKAANSILDDEDGPAQPTSGKREDKTCR